MIHLTLQIDKVQCSGCVKCTIKYFKKTNKMLGKDEFNCDYKILEKRWLKNKDCESKGY